MEQLSVDMTYATALFEAAGDAGIQEQISEEAHGILDVFQEEPDFHRFFCTPGIPADEKKEVLTNVLAGKISSELLNFMCILVDKGRVRHFERMVRAYDTLLDQANGIASGEVFSAAPLSDDQIRRLEEQTGKLIGENVQLENHVGKSLIGGVRVQVAGKIFDASLKRKLEDMRSRMQ